MRDYKVTIKGQSGTISYTVFKTEKGAYGVANRVAKEAFWGEEVEITVEAMS